MRCHFGGQGRGLTWHQVIDDSAPRADASHAPARPEPHRPRNTRALAGSARAWRGIPALLLPFGLLLSCDRGDPASQSPPAERPPNVIYILADDLGYGDLGAYNAESRIPTPHLDRLASEGMRFVDAHSPASVCTPTRYALLTGRYSWRSPLERSVLWSYGETLIEPERLTLARLLGAQGYSTAVVGKWHLGLDWTFREPLDELRGTDRARVNDRGLLMDVDDELVDFEGPVGGGPISAGFDESFILPASLDIPPYVYLENNRLVAPVTEETEGNDLDTGATGAFWRPGPMMEGFDFYDVLPRFTRRAIAHIESKGTAEEPFFLYLPLPAPHALGADAGARRALRRGSVR